MSIILSQNPKIKPAIWMCDPGTVAYNCARMGLPMPISLLSIWKSGDKLFDIAGRYTSFAITGADWGAGGLHFDANSEKVDIDDSAPSGSHFSMFTVVIPYDVGNGSGRVIRALSGGSDNWGVKADKLMLYDLGSAGSTLGSTTIYNNIEYRICYVHDGLKDYLYLNGKLDLERNVSGSFNFMNGDLGALPGYSAYNFRGTIKSFITWDVSLTPHQVTTLSANPYGLIEPIRSPAIWSAPAVGVAPTGTFYGPLYGPLGGPI